MWGLHRTTKCIIHGARKENIFLLLLASRLIRNQWQQGFKKGLVTQKSKIKVRTMDKEPEFKDYVDCWHCDVSSWSGDVLLIGDNDFNSKLQDYDDKNHECSCGDNPCGENGTILQTTGHRDDRKFSLNSGQRVGGSSPPLPNHFDIW